MPNSKNLLLPLLAFRRVPSLSSFSQSKKGEAHNTTKPNTVQQEVLFHTLLPALRWCLLKGVLRARPCLPFFNPTGGVFKGLVTKESCNEPTYPLRKLLGGLGLLRLLPLQQENIKGTQHQTFLTGFGCTKPILLRGSPSRPPAASRSAAALGAACTAQCAFEEILPVVPCTKVRTIGLSMPELL